MHVYPDDLELTWMSARLSGAAGIAAALLGLSAVLLATLLCGAGCGIGGEGWSEDGSFSWRSNSLSDLGVSSVAVVFNYAVVIAGVLNFVFAVGFVRTHATGPPFYIAGVLLVLGGGSLSLVGIYTEVAGALHTYASLGYFLMVPVAMVVIGVAFVRAADDARGFSTLGSGLVALLVILGALLLGWHRWLGLGLAVPEYIEALVIGSWIAAMGFDLFS